MGMPSATTGFLVLSIAPGTVYFSCPAIYIAIVCKLVPCLLSGMESVSRSSVMDQREP